jgi:IclR family KDG regulon transcriptional repressor
MQQESISEASVPHKRNGRDHSIQSVRRAAALLRAFGGGSTELGVSELARRVQLHKSTASRLLATLESEGLLERVPGSEKYRLGYEIVRRPRPPPHLGDLRIVARPFLVELAEATRETTNLAVLDGDLAHNIDQESSQHIVRVGDWTGRRTPLHCVANGKALLAFRPAPELERLTSGPLERFTSNTLTDPKALRAELARVRGLGYATALGEIEDGLHAVAAPVRDRTGQVVAALSVSAPAYRLTPAQVPELGALTRQMADRISLRLGYQAN